MGTYGRRIASDFSSCEFSDMVCPSRCNVTLVTVACIQLSDRGYRMGHESQETPRVEDLRHSCYSVHLYT